MTKPDICVKIIKLSFAVDSPATQKIINSQPGLNKSVLGSLLQNIDSHYSVRDDLIIHRVVLDLGNISCQHFSIHFHQRLHSALVKLFIQLEAITRNAPAPAREAAQSTREQADTLLLAQAIACLQPATLAPAGAALPAAMLYPLLEQAVNARSVSDPVSATPLAAFSPHPATASRQVPQQKRSARMTSEQVTLLALHYLLLENEGVRWLSQHSMRHEMRDALAAAIVHQGIPAERLLCCIACLEALPVAHARSVAGRWIIPLWRYAGMVQAVQQQAGKEAAVQAARYLASLLPGRPASSSSAAYTEQQTSRASDIGQNHQVSSASNSRQNHQVSSASNSRQNRQAAEAAASQHRHGVRRPQGYPSSEEFSASGLPVTNAGIILFWPLFTPWFTTLGLMEEKKFVSDEARWQAVVAMDWLVWEQETPAVERLVVNQFLCGLPLSEPPAPLAPLSLELQQRTLAWVEAISAQLAAFEKMSLNDIRQLFLQRPGELFADLTPAVLHIEPQPFDLLLTKWPWPLNLAYFPWFDAPLMIEWPGSEPAGARL